MIGRGLQEICSTRVAQGRIQGPQGAGKYATGTDGMTESELIQDWLERDFRSACFPDSRKRCFILKTSMFCATKFLAAFAIDLEKQKSLVELRKMTGNFGTSIELNQSMIRTSAVFSNCLVDKVFVDTVTKHIPTFVSDADELTESI